MSKFFSSLAEQALSRTTESTLSILGITDPGLRKHLGDLMRSESGSEGSFLAPPLFEQTFGWQESDRTMEQLTAHDRLLSGHVVDSLDDESNGRYRFGRIWKPFTHQLASWRSLLEKQRSVMVTSGTGSGKTECFMVPVLEDLYREYQETGTPLVGVRALFLYPLNALINSQRERLHAWTRSYGNGVRYCLYNGNTEELQSKVRSEQKLRPNQILSRELLREQPAPILVTNGTMLEYMMVRQVDAPIIQISRQQKSLRWIVLDEAHTYVGSQAAELALQLRRVMTAFGVTPEEVRFVATSATIAGEGEGAEEQLKQFLSDLSGVPISRIDVWGGQRVVPELESAQNQTVSLEELEGMPATNEDEPDIHPERFQALVHSPESRVLRDLLVKSPKPLKVTELASKMEEVGGWQLSQAEVFRWLDVCTGTKPNAADPAFLKLRAHFLQRTTHGLWACFDQQCSAKQDTALCEEWPFGYVYVSHRQTCTCGSPVFELAFCRDCNEPHLLAKDKNGKLTQWDSSVGDEFSLQAEASLEEGHETEGDAVRSITIPLVLAAQGNESQTYIPAEFDKYNGAFAANSSERVTLRLEDSELVCSRNACSYRGMQGSFPFRRAMLGGPFYVANAVPTVLEYCQDYKDEETKGIGAQSLPGRGRRLITFTDSRQGTARMAVRMQQEAERSRLRGLVVEILRWSQKSQLTAQAEPADIPTDQLRALIAKAEDDVNLYQSLDMPGEIRLAKERVDRFKSMLTAAEGGVVRPLLASLSWAELVGELKQRSDLQTNGPVMLANRYQKPEIFKETDGPHKLAEMLLFREFMRRPKRQNSLETQGLIKVGYLGLDKISKSPAFWEQKGLTLDDWRDFLKVALDFHVRENSFIAVSDEWKLWIGSRFSAKTLRTPESLELDESRVKRWPQIRNDRHSQRLIKLLLLGSGLNPVNPVDVDMVNSWLKEAWMQLTTPGSALKPDGNRFYLPREHMTFSLVDFAYACPVTNKLIDTTFKGYTPYLPANMDFSTLTDGMRDRLRSEQVELPRIWEFDLPQNDHELRLSIIRDQVAGDSTIKDLRARNLWTDINDRAMEGGFYYRTAEHSAQQSAERLIDYEDKFKQGKINVLNCSTTMEMGVDIGGISAVVMNNVPPHPANYLQRAGRSGRSKESRAIAYTLCKNNPHDQQVFANPSWPFETMIPAPMVSLSSVRLVQRHVNALVLSDFLCNVVGPTQAEKTSLNTQWLYDDTADHSQCDKLLERLGLAQIADLDEAISELVRGTALAGVRADQLRRKAADKLRELQDRWRTTFRFLAEEEQKAKPGSPYLKRLQLERSRHCNEYLLRDLSARTFLPGYGFPTDVVNFDNFTIEDYLRIKTLDTREGRDREDNVSRYKGLPSRNLSIAIREYAPGANIVLDGRVFRSAGVSLHWHNLNANTREAQKMDLAWRCDKCGEVGYEEGVVKADELTCTNGSCHVPIKSANTRKVLQPSGFVTDAYQSTSNDIQHQKFIPVEPAWVFVNAPRTPLPNPALGAMAYGAEGRVFHHSSGEHGAGYALCMSCGRAESMLAFEEYPSTLSPSGEHVPPRPTKDDKDQNNKRMPCPGAGAIIPNVSLGATAYTDVFELTLRHPVSGEYIADTDQGIAIAMTLAVALRAALAEVLGIATSEIGYATRPSRLDSGKPIRVIQLFDVISGGAGFSTSVPLHIERLFGSMVNKLHCTRCDTGCSDCLLDSETRHDHDRLDRQAALEWLGVDFANYVGLTEEDKLSLADAEYMPGSVESVLRRLINAGAERITLFTSEDTAEWDLFAPQFRRAIQNYVLTDNVAVDLIIPYGVQNPELLEDLWSLASIGVNIGYQQPSVYEHFVAQVAIDSELHTLATRSQSAKVPGSEWHQSDELVVRSRLQPSVKWAKAAPVPKVTGAKDLSIHDELNGPLLSFGKHFWQLVGRESPQVLKMLEDKKLQRLSYSDRYIQNPAAVAILGALFLSLKPNMQPGTEVQVKTLFKAGRLQGQRAFEDWGCQEDFHFFAEKWLSAMVGNQVELTVETTNRDIAHHRKLELEFEDSSRLKVRFDQGVGYWRLRFKSARDSWFDFNLDKEEQVLRMGKAVDKAVVFNSEQKWSTDVLVEIL
ncbi:DEAD/DEAH box helicase [Halomonas sp.]|uniref:DEAD/DEAH box helicase n=1 Tax=Halomonas sp. TaxID=1486246 RepID=UPI00384BA38F